MFDNVKSFSIIKSSDIEGVIQGCLDMINEEFYPLGLPFKRGKKYMQVIIEYKKTKKCQIN